MVYRNNIGRLGAGFISMCLETRWLGQKRGVYVLEPPCTRKKHYFLCHFDGLDQLLVGTGNSYFIQSRPGIIHSKLNLLQV